MSANTGRGNFIGTDASYKASKLGNNFSGRWTLEDLNFYRRADNWAFPGTVTIATVSAASTSYTLLNGDSITLVTSSTPGTLGNNAATWTLGIGNSGSSYRRDSTSALDYLIVGPTSPFPISISAPVGGNWVIEMSGGGGNGGGDSTGGGGGGGYTVWSGSIPKDNTSAMTAKIGQNGGPPSGDSSLTHPLFTLTANGGGNGNGGGCDTRGPGGGGGGASGGNIVNAGGGGGGSGSTACGGCSDGGGAGGNASYGSQFYPDNTTLNTIPDPWGGGYSGTCGHGTIRNFGGGGGQPGGDNATGASGGYGFIRLVFRGGL